MRFKLTVLGSCSALPTISKYPSAHVLNVHEQFYLIDCGEGTQKQLKVYDINHLKINHIFISHLHGDHCYGLFGLISSMGLMGRTRVLEIFGPAPLKQLIENHIKFFETRLAYPIICHEVDCKNMGTIYENSVMEVSTLPLKHSINCVGYLFKEKTPQLNVSKDIVEKYNLSIAQTVSAKRGEDLELSDGTILSNSDITYTPYTPRSMAYCCDTLYREKLIEYIKGVDLLIHEATYLAEDRVNAKKRFHSTTHDAATIATKAEVKKLVITHFSTRYSTPTSRFLDEAKTIFDNTVLAKEGKEIEIPLIRHNK